MFSTKRGQAAAGAAILLVIILGMLIMFILFISPSERAELLGDPSLAGTSSSSSSSSSSGSGYGTIEKNLLRESPGRLDYFSHEEIEHPLPVINIFTRTEAKILAEMNTAYAKKSVFSEESGKLTFSVTDLPNTDNLLLTFKVESLEGDLIIELNGQELYRGQPSTEPITIPKNYLQEENTLIFRVSSPGVAFWATNKASLKKISVVADVTNTQAQVSQSTLLISEVEKRNMEKVVLRLQPECNPNAVGPLIIKFNEDTIYHGVPDCNVEMVPIELSPALVQQGENHLTFSTDRGNYILSHLTVNTRLKEVDYPTYYFDLSLEEYNNIKDNNKKVKLRLSFVDVTENKYGQLLFNGGIRSFDTDEAAYTTDVTGDIVKGTNSIKIKPKKTIEVRELRADLVR